MCQTYHFSHKIEHMFTQAVHHPFPHFFWCCHSADVMMKALVRLIHFLVLE